MLIFQEIVVCVTHSPVTVADQNNPGMGIQRQHRRIAETFVQSSLTACFHGILLIISVSAPAAAFFTASFALFIPKDPAEAGWQAEIQAENTVHA